MAAPLSILVISDTHNHLPPNLEQLATGVDEIWHLGDVVAPKMLDAIKKIGPPVTVVHGNCDSYPSWPLVARLDRNGVRFHLVHIPPRNVPPDTDVVLHGHTHVPRDETVGGVRFLNPGCVTRPNRGAPASAAHLEISESGELQWELVLLR
jgi:putative phosphoesterase